MTVAGMPQDFIAAFAAVRSRVDEALVEALRERLVAIPPRLLGAIEYALLAPGKRLRPALVIWSAAACGCELNTTIMSAAIAVEMIHAYSLVHDDLPAMDNDDLRRGRPTCHRQYDEATAILVGDGLQTMAFEVLAQQLPAEIAARCCLELARAAGCAGMVGGQHEDLAAENRFADQPAVPRKVEILTGIHARKTGALIRASMVLGGLTAGAKPAEIAALSTYGESIGQAFQIADDLLDVNGNQEQAGKRVGKDSGLGKMTYPALFGPDESLRLAHQLADQAVAVIKPFGMTAWMLEALARYVVERKH